MADENNSQVGVEDKTETVTVAPENQDGKSEEQNSTTVTPADVAAKAGTPQVAVEEDKASPDADDTTNSNKDEDENSVVTRRKAKQLASENRTLRNAKKELATENETLKTQLEELNNKVLEYETQISEAQYKNLVSEVKTKFGLNDRQAKYLSGDTLEDLEKSAKEIVEDLGIRPPVDFSNLTTGSGNSASSSVFTMSEEEILKQYS